MSKPRYTLTSYDPIYVVAEELRIPEEAIRDQALRWLKNTLKGKGGEPRLTDAWVSDHTEDFNNVEELLIFIRYNMYRENREAQQLADQDVICKELSERLVEDIPEDLLESAIMDATIRLEEMIGRSGSTIENFCKQRKISQDQLYEDVRKRTIQSLKEDTALEAYAQYRDFSLEPEDFYEIIPGDNIQDKARKRKQIELEGRLSQMEQYALKTKALKEIMENAMIKRKPTDAEWMRYGDTSVDVLEANKQFPEGFVSL